MNFEWQFLKALFELLMLCAVVFGLAIGVASTLLILLIKVMI